MTIDESISQLSNAFKKLQTDTEMINQTLSYIRTPLEDVSKQAASANNILKDILTNTMILNIDITDSISRMIESQKLKEDMDKFENEFEIFSYNFVCIMSAREVMSVYKKWKDGDKIYIENYFNQKFEDRANLDNLIEKIITNKHFIDRKEIISDTFDAHYNRKYTLSIPVLFAQIDGIFNNAYKHILTSEEKIICEKCGRQINNTNPWAKTIARKLKNENVGHNFSKKFLKFIYKKYDEDRNSILHGLKTDYACQDLSTRLIVSLYELYITLEKRTEF